MFKSLKRKFDEFKFDAMIRHRIEKTKELLDKYGSPSNKEIIAICTLYAKEIVLRNLGREDEEQIEHVLAKVLKAREEIQTMFESDGYSKDFAYALSHVCVGWDWDSYKEKNLNPNLTLSCLLKSHTQYRGIFSESMLLKKDP